MSKSLGNVIVPQKVVNSLGADVLRLWIAATDYANEMSLSDEILKQVADSYRRIRNTTRFLLGNLAGFDPAKDNVAQADLVSIDQWALWRAAQLQEEIITAYRNYEFHLVHQKLHNFCIVDLGGFYLDVLKDRLYTTPTKSLARRSAQTAMYQIVQAMARWLAPILSFTAEEIADFTPARASKSIFLETWLDLPAHHRPQVDWDRIINIRSAVSRELEKLRAASKIGAPLDAAVHIYCDGASYESLQTLGNELRFAFITSGANVSAAADRPADAVEAELADRSKIWIVVQAVDVPKCVRCREKQADVGNNPAHPELCGRCVTNVETAGETRRFI
jgi:isoleucyl-tRNA synthetase